MIRNFLQRAAHRTHRSGHQKFLSATRELEKTQREKLADYLSDPSRPLRVLRPGASYEEFRELYPVTAYTNWESAIETLRAQRSIRFEPTSGSTSKRKWIPYPPKLLREFDAAASAWLYNLGQTYPATLRGTHYWSLSWLPDELRSEIESTNDLQLFGGIKRTVMEKIMSVPNTASTLATLERSKFASLVYLSASRDLSLISVWSPTFLLGILEDLSNRKNEIARVLETGSWEGMENLPAPKNQKAARLLRSWNGLIEPGFTSRLWPKLSVISAWDSATSALWADRVRALFPNVPFQGKGLWATEGCVSFPYQGKMPLAIHTHFYEFRNVESEEIIPSWKLETGMRVKPILTTASGFTRYEMQDVVRVIDRLNQVPCLEFEGRANTIDMAGEKIDAQLAQNVLTDLGQSFGISGLSLLARLNPPPTPENPSGKPYYAVLAEGKPELSSAVSKAAEDLLCEIHHYRLARELGQLSAAQALVREDALRFCGEILNPAQKISGSTKVESLALWKT